MKDYVVAKRIADFIENKDVVRGVELASKHNMFEKISQKYLKQYVNKINNDYSELRQLRVGMEVLKYLIKIKGSKESKIKLRQRKEIQARLKVGRKRRISGGMCCFAL